MNIEYNLRKIAQELNKLGKRLDEVSKDETAYEEETQERFDFVKKEFKDHFSSDIADLKKHAGTLLHCWEHEAKNALTVVLSNLERSFKEGDLQQMADDFQEIGNSLENVRSALDSFNSIMGESPKFLKHYRDGFGI